MLKMVSIVRYNMKARKNKFKKLIQEYFLCVGSLRNSALFLYFTQIELKQFLNNGVWRTLKLF